MIQTKPIFRCFLSCLIVLGWLNTARAQTQLQLKTGVVDHNVFVSLSQAGVPDDVALTMMREISQVIHLDTAIKASDRFAVLFDKAAFGSSASNKLLAFEYTHDTAVFAAYWFSDGVQSGFYQDDGVSMRPAFLRTPLEVARITSTVGARKHPIHKVWLTHEGTDFAAPTGTRVFAASDGEVQFLGSQNGFGKVIKLKHGSDTQTVYAHLVAFAPQLKTGVTVKQGDVIGFVGSTGWATGPHLHYEYRIANKPVDPFSTNLPVNTRVAPEQAKAFEAQLNSLRSYFALLKKPVATALNASAPSLKSESIFQPRPEPRSEAKSEPTTAASQE